MKAASSPLSGTNTRQLFTLAVVRTEVKHEYHLRFKGCWSRLRSLGVAKESVDHGHPEIRLPGKIVTAFKSPVVGHRGEN